MFLNKNKNSRFSYIYSSLLGTLVDRLKTTAVFLYTILSRFFLSNKESSALDEYYSNAPQHWLDLIKRNHLNLNSFKRNAIKKHFRPGKEPTKDNSFKVLTNTEQKITTTRAADYRKNKSAARLFFNNKNIFSNLAENVEEQISKANDVHKKKVKMHFSSMLPKKKYMQSANKVHKVELIKKRFMSSGEQIVKVDTENDTVNKVVIKENIQSIMKKSAEYNNSMIKKNDNVIQIMNVDKNNHTLSFSDNRDYERNLSGFSYKEKSNKKVMKDSYIEPEKELLPEMESQWLSSIHKNCFVSASDNISFNELEINYWQNLPDDVWSNISLDNIYTLKKIPGNNDVREILWIG